MEVRHGGRPLAGSAQGWAWRRRGSCKAPKRARCSCWTLDRICHERRALQHAARGRWQAAARQQHLNCSEQVLRLPRKAECSRQQHTLPAVQVKSKGDLPKPYSEIVEPYSGALGDGIEAGAAAHSPGCVAAPQGLLEAMQACQASRCAIAQSSLLLALQQQAGNKDQLPRLPAACGAGGRVPSRP